ncbi:M23 family metallopeptidase [Pantanalinema rosaneae CENA516]|uniref:M23 family metallopeptidase n=1 Tax=Pantanalinema rosaneae TaxID=1620701 RepID=UPI003D6DEB8F
MKSQLITTLAIGFALTIAPKSTPALPTIAATTEPIDPYPTYIYPVQGVLTSGFGHRWGRMHKGIDLAAATGTPIVASAAGTVTYAGWNEGGYGNLVELQHTDGSLTRYAHNSRVLVRVGEQVSQGQVIAELGSTGRSTGPHCHFEIVLPGQGAVDPIAYLPSRANVAQRR